MTLLVFASIGLIWQALVVGFSIPPYIVPRPLGVLHAVVTQWKALALPLSITASAAALGLTVSALTASLIAVAFSMSRGLAQASLPVVLVFRSMPVAAVAPIMTLMMGRGIGVSIAVVTIISFFPILVNLMRGLTSADNNAAELLHVYGASKLQQMRLMRIPYALPYLFTGLRISGTSAILGAMLSEWITGTRGLGKLILDAGDMREIELLWAAVLISILLALVVFWATATAEKKMLSWKA
ncbi:MAG TPA: ABC transporter permease subunit [Pseudolabrys sp.]|nr:ABC transporter permease subunit [Pseudolabrys sp.]